MLQNYSHFSYAAIFLQKIFTLIFTFSHDELAETPLLKGVSADK